jgi:hypothetical protein
MTLGCPVVNLIGLDAVQRFDQVGGIRDITVVEEEPHAVDVRNLIEMIDALGIELNIDAHRMMPCTS